MNLPDRSASRAVLIGTSTYKYLPSLPSVHNNVTALARCLMNPELWGIPAENTCLVTDPASHADMLDAIHSAAGAASDTLFVYYAGHGLLDARNSLLLGLTGTISGRVHTATPYDWIRDSVLECRASRRVVVLDCCYSGRALGAMSDGVSEVADEAAAEGTYVIAAASENKRATAPVGQYYTAFTGALIELLEHGEPDGPEFWTLDATYLHLRTTLRSRGYPEPQKRDRNTAGAVALARNRAFRARTAPAEPGGQREVVGGRVSADRAFGAGWRRQALTLADVESISIPLAPGNNEGLSRQPVDEFMQRVRRWLSDPMAHPLAASETFAFAAPKITRIRGMVKEQPNFPKAARRETGYVAKDFYGFLERVRDEIFRKEGRLWVGVVERPPTVGMDHRRSAPVKFDPSRDVMERLEGTESEFLERLTQVRNGVGIVRSENRERFWMITGMTGWPFFMSSYRESLRGQLSIGDMIEFIPDTPMWEDMMKASYIRRMVRIQ
ncbi:MAG: caspase family protein [Actinobacteria bacterium]|nr:caspase family protein [Actinomycetota bacterium]